MHPAGPKFFMFIIVATPSVKIKYLVKWRKSSFSISQKATFFLFTMHKNVQHESVISVERIMVFYLLLLAEYASKEISQIVASKERWQGDLLPETL